MQREVTMKIVLGALVLLECLFAPVAAIPQAADLIGLRLIVLRTEAEAADILARMQAGEKFEDLARNHSVDSSASAGGYLGTFTIGQLRRELHTAVKDLSPGQVSGLVRMGGQFALIQLLPDKETRAIELKSWVDAGADSRSPVVERLWTLAVAANDTAVIRTLVNAGADVNKTFGDGSTVLMGAAQAGQLESVRALLAAGASVNAATRFGSSGPLSDSRGMCSPKLRLPPDVVPQRTT